MIREYSDTDGLVPTLHLIIYRGYESLVEILDGLEFQFEVAIVTCLVAGFYMYEYKVVVLQCLYGCLRLSFVVGVRQSCSAFHLDNLQTSIVTDATN